MNRQFWQQWLLTDFLPNNNLWQRYLISLLIIVVTLWLAHPLRHVVDAANIAMLCLLVVVIVAIKLGRRPAILVSLVSVMGLDFFFVSPHGSFAVLHTQYIFTLLVMLIVALIITYLASDLRRQLVEANQREQHLAELYELTKAAQESKMQIASERLRNSILSALSHDIRTPLTALHSLAETLVLSTPDLSDENRKIALAMRVQTLSLHNMVNNLLEMARLQTNPVKLRKEWQLLDEVIGASIQWLKLPLQQHKIVVHLPPQLPLVEFDAHLLQRVFCNLLENAAKYSPLHSTIEIQVSLTPSEVCVAIYNAGNGFPTDKIQNLFNLFERGLQESTIPGFGLGLSICRVIIEAHQGRIWAFNPESGGSCVSFALACGTPPLVETEWMPPTGMIC